MKDIYVNLYSAGGAEDYYIPVPCRGVVKDFEVMANATMVATGTIILSRSTTAVNTATAPVGNTAAGTVLKGVPDTTNKGLVFDPASSTAANTKIKVALDTTILGGVANVLLHIVFDDSAYVEQAASEAQSLTLTRNPLSFGGGDFNGEVNLSGTGDVMWDVRITIDNKNPEMITVTA